MKVVLDTNVFLSGVFFGGLPYEILRAWRDRRLRLVYSPDILDEYRRTGEKLTRQFEGVDLDPFLALVVTEGKLFVSPALLEAVCDDPEDDKFFAWRHCEQMQSAYQWRQALAKGDGIRRH